MNVRGVLLLTSLLFCGATVAQESLVNASINEKAADSRDTQQAQKKIDTLATQQTELIAEYRVTLQQLERTKIYNEHLQTIVDAQLAERDSIKDQLTNFGQVERDIVPLMQDMIADLESFVGLDMPFQMQERTQRVQRLQALMGNPNVAISEKYRRIMEAYKIEMDFGTTTEQYAGALGDGAARREVDFVRLGRLVLAYQTRDRSETGFYNLLTQSYEPLDNSYRESVTQAIRFARKETPPSLLRLPVPAPQAGGVR